MKKLVKGFANGVFLAFAFIPAALSGFGRFEAVFIFFAQVCALTPGLPGDYLRIAFYRLTLAHCSLSSRVSFGSFFAHAQAKLFDSVYIGSYCVIGRAEIGSRTQIASGVQILSGRRQHARDEEGALSGAEKGEFVTLKIGDHCWIGASAVVMADVGAGSTIGAGAVVTREIPAGSVATGVPARVHS